MYDVINRNTKLFSIPKWCPCKKVLIMRKLTWDSFVAPQITDDTLGLAAHHAIESCANGTPSSSAIGFRLSTFLSTSSTSDRDARFYNTRGKAGKEIIAQWSKQKRPKQFYFYPSYNNDVRTYVNLEGNQSLLLWCWYV